MLDVTGAPSHGCWRGHTVKNVITVGGHNGISVQKKNFFILQSGGNFKGGGTLRLVDNLYINFFSFFLFYKNSSLIMMLIYTQTSERKFGVVCHQEKNIFYKHTQSECSSNLYHCAPSIHHFELGLLLTWSSATRAACIHRVHKGEVL